MQDSEIHKIHLFLLMSHEGHFLLETSLEVKNIIVQIDLHLLLNQKLLLNNQNLFLDIVAPAGDTLEKRPLVLHQFGGGFLIGWRTKPVIPQMAEMYAKRGFVFATIDYRLGFNPLDGQSAERAVYRASQDLRAALRFLVDNADLYGIDTSAIFLTRTSAGCL